MSSIADRVLRGTFWVSLARIAVNIFALLSTFMLAWFLTPQDFGLVAIASTVIFVISVATELSLTSALVRHEAPDESHLNAAWTLNAIRSLGICLFTCAISWPIASIYNDQRLVPVLCVFGGSLFISGLANPRMAIAQRDLQFRPDFIVQTGQKLVGLIASFAWAYTFRDYWALVVGSVATQAANVLLSYIVLPYRPRILFRHFREFFSFSGWVLASQIVNTLNWRFDQLLVGKMFGPHVLGFYSMGSNLAQLPTREAILPLTKPLFPAFVAVRNDRNQLAAAYLRAQCLVAALALPIGLGVALTAEPLILLGLGVKWSQSIPVVQAIATIGALQPLGVLVHPLAMALGQTQKLFKRDVVVLIVRMASLFVGGYIFGLSGVIAGNVITGAGMIIINMLLVRNLTGLKVIEQLKANLRTIIASLVMILSIVMISPSVYKSMSLDYFPIFCLIAASGAVTYVLTLACLWKAQGSPNGPEAEILRVFQKALRNPKQV